MFNRRFTTRLGPGVGAPAEARRFIGATLAPLAPDLVPDVQLAVSELVTNAVIHTDEPAPITLELRLGGGQAKVTVSTTRSILPRRPVQGAGGHGLEVVESVSDEWGITGGSVWCAFSLRRAGSAAHPAFC